MFEELTNILSSRKFVGGIILMGTCASVREYVPEEMKGLLNAGTFLGFGLTLWGVQEGLTAPTTKYNVAIVSDRDIYNIGEDITFTIRVTDINGLPVPNLEVKVYKQITMYPDRFLCSCYTDNTGTCTCTISAAALGEGDHIIKAKIEGGEGQCVVSVVEEGVVQEEPKIKLHPEIVDWDIEDAQNPLSSTIKVKFRYVEYTECKSGGVHLDYWYHDLGFSEVRVNGVEPPHYYVGFCERLGHQDFQLVEVYGVNHDDLIEIILEKRARPTITYIWRRAWAPIPEEDKYLYVCEEGWKDRARWPEEGICHPECHLPDGGRPCHCPAVKDTVTIL